MPLNKIRVVDVQDKLGNTTVSLEVADLGATKLTWEETLYLCHELEHTIQLVEKERKLAKKN